jgi:hypothetical protein
MGCGGGAFDAPFSGFPCPRFWAGADGIEWNDPSWILLSPLDPTLPFI